MWKPESWLEFAVLKLTSHCTVALFGSIMNSFPVNSQTPHSYRDQLSVYQYFLYWDHSHSLDYEATGLQNTVLIPGRERAARRRLWELVLHSCAKLFVPVSPMGAGIQDNSQHTLLLGHAPTPTSLLQMHTLLLWCECPSRTDTD